MVSLLEGWVRVANLLISGRGLGKRQRKLFEDFSIPLPPDCEDGGDGLTLRELIARIVGDEVDAFVRRQEARRLTKVLSPRQIENAAERGKIEMGGRSEPAGEVDLAAAIHAAHQAFVDGLYLVVIDGVEQRDLDAQVYLQADSHITFIRLTFLAGA